MNWWLIESWREIEKLKQEQLGAHNPDSKAPVYYFNPDCKHDRCSYDIATCPKCIEYTNQKKKENAKLIKTI